MTAARKYHLQTGGRDAGFSLIELIVSLALFAMILALLPGAFRTGKRGWETAAVIEQVASAEASADFLRHRLADATPFYDRDESGRARIAFSGGPQQLSFVAPSQAGPSGGGFYRWSIATAPAGETSALMLTMAPFSAVQTDATATATERVLLNGVRALRIRYFGAEEADGEAVWADEWRRSDQLPQLIEIEAETLQSRTASFGPLRVALRLSQPGEQP